MVSELVGCKFKFKPEDFVVEEIGDDWSCKVSDVFPSGVSPDLSSLDPVSDRSFLCCELEKFSIDHFRAMKDFSSALSLSPRNVSYAGSKDRIAHTSQRISIFNPNLDKLKSFSHPNLFLKNFRWSKRKIKMGYLLGNHFRIVLRDVDKKSAVKVSSKLRSLTSFPNFFGSQRFGSVRKNNVAIGKLILKRDFESAVWAILTQFSSDERPDIQFARKKLLREKDFSSAAKYFPFILRLEKQLLFYLSRKPKDFVGALKSCDRKNILLFVHAVQSQVFNDVISQALDEGLSFSSKPQLSGMLPGYKMRFSQGRLGDLEREVLSSHSLSLEDFDVREIPFLRIKGSYRKALVEVGDLSVDVVDDELFSSSKKLVLNFFLPSGVYATTFLQNFFVFD